MSVKKILVGTVIALAVIATGIYVFREPLATMAIQKIATKRMAENPLASLPDGLYIGLCGAGSPFPDPKRSPACTAVIAGKRLFLIDAGSAASRNLNAMGFNPPMSKRYFSRIFIPIISMAWVSCFCNDGAVLGVLNRCRCMAQRASR